MPKRKKYKITVQVRDYAQSNAWQPANKVKVKFDTNGNVTRITDFGDNPLKEETGFVEMPGDNVIEAIVDRNPRWVKINGRWYYI